MKQILVACAFIAASGLSFRAQADQCEELTQPQAEQAIKLIQSAKRVDLFCQLCGDKSPTPVVVSSVTEATDFEAGYADVQLNGKIADLAYLYVDGRNLADLVDCPTTGVYSELPSSSK